MSAAPALEPVPAGRYKTTMPRASPRRVRITARASDRFELYQRAVQTPERDARFLSRHFEQTTGQPLRLLREDFCGTALLACWFVKLHRQNRALGVDRHWPTLAWGRIHNVRRLLDPDQQRRLRLVQRDVRAVRAPAVQAIAALNFSYSVFQSRAELGRYLAACHRALRPGGMLFVDAWGGPDAIATRTDRVRHRGFDYLWQQRAFDPITHRIECAIHFAFRDGTMLRNAFIYDWRLWTLPELRELFAAAGFADVHVLWASADRRRRAGSGVFRRAAVGTDAPAWLAYVVGRRPAGPRRSPR